MSSEAIELFQIEINRRFLFLRARGPSLELSIPEIIPPEEGIITQGLGLNADQLTGGSLKGPGLMTEAATEDLDPKIVQLTANLLKEGPCFTPEVERDQGRELRCGRTVAQMQGCSAFCKKAFSCTAGTPLVLSPQYLRNWQEQHQLINDLPYNNTYLSLKYKRIGHAFNLAGMIELPYQEYAVLEGNNETFLFPSLHAAFNQFASSRTDLISDQMRISIADSLSKAVWHENATEEKIDEIYANIHDPNFCDSMIIGGGHDWHSIQYIFRKTPSGEIFLFCCNRGEGSDLKPGIVILRVQNPQAITKDFLKGLARRLITTKEEHLSLKKIKEKLQGVETAFIAMKSGKVGNCVYLNYKTAFFALLLIENLKDHLEVSNFNFPTQKLESVQQIYKEFSRFDASAVLEDFLIDLKQPISKQFLEGENETYWKGVRQMAWLLQDRFNGYLDRVNLGEQPKVSHELLQKARKNINSFFETFPL